ncbi:SLBB domain-containing protein [Psychrobium sp. 1_MG-2023]|uniref:SLBB domain-containing protein n=1 Tax=Psychrobium sp. 1_MG-2023 TaxID=3062624 RepID=UPI000C32B452|nr:SLBB domain-containing protein [Psychrobium sp. 1_MG-2023]MDP2561337.1 SLBB domain-containing protein [Psychrobium sp. 1_MG-2023]PKF54151.1 sugar ABC transporter substrate-binding protein [Alteromonadales bacterium alter-6D02]
MQTIISIKYWVLIVMCSLLLSTSVGAKEAYLVQLGDVVHVGLPGEESLNKNFTVDVRGGIKLPEVGSITVVGYSELELKQILVAALQPVYRDMSGFSVYVAKKQLMVNVMGYVKAPGHVTLPASANIQMALIAAGGLRTGAQLDKLQIRRNGTSQVFNYKQYLDSGDSSILPNLQPLDTLFIPASPMVGNIEVEFDPAKVASGGDAADRLAIKVFGEVHRQGSFSFNNKTNLVEFLMKAGGVTRYAGVEHIRVITDGQPQLFNLKNYLDSGNITLLPELKPGATIFVPKQEEQIKTGANVVYIMGEVFKPGAFEGKADATFMDILANAGGPTRFAESRQIKIIKASGEVMSFDLAGYTEGIASAQLPSISSGDAIFVPEKTDMNEKSWLKVSPNRAVRVIGEVVRPGRYEWANEMSLIDLLAHVGGPTSRADTANIDITSPDGYGALQQYTFNLDNFIKQGVAESALPVIRAGATIRVHDLPSDPSDNKAQWVRQSAAKSIYVFGQVGAPGRYMFTEEMNFLDILAAADGPTAKADIRNIRINHRGTGQARVSKLNLALYFETGDEHLLPEIKMGDTIYIPERNRDWLDKPKEVTVRVLGAVNKPGRYSYDDTMTILDLLAEAGGTVSTAYIEKITVVNLSCCRSQARTFDLAEFSETANFSDLPVIRVGDTVYVPDQRNTTMAKARVGLRDVFELVSLASLLGVL